MSDRARTYDVFISHAVADVKLATEVADACRANGLDVLTDADLLPGENAGEALWEALSECHALVTVLSPTGVTPSMAIEFGAARAWNKPIFGIVSDLAVTSVPLALSGMRLYALGRLDDVIKAIKVSRQELSETDRTLLAGLYATVGSSVDELALDARKLDKLVKRFISRSGKAVSGEHLLSELLRMRKQGKLKRTGSPRSAAANKAST